MHHHDLKTALDGFSISAACLAFFEAIPWPAIAGFLSCLWISTRLYEYFKCKYAAYKKEKAEKAAAEAKSGPEEQADKRED